MIDPDALLPGYAFKFVESKWANSVQAGSVRIGTLVDFMVMEGDRRDELEGMAIRRPSRDFRFTADTPQAELAAFERKTGMKIGPFEGNGSAEIHAKQFVRYTSGYCFCTSRRLAAAPAEEHVAFKVDTVAFGRAVSSRYREKLGERLDAGSVNYATRVGDFDDESLIDYDPFVKDPKFKQEDEYRFFWPDPPRIQEAKTEILDLMRQGLYAFTTGPDAAIAAALERLT